MSATHLILFENQKRGCKFTSLMPVMSIMLSVKTIIANSYKDSFGGKKFWHRYLHQNRITLQQIRKQLYKKYAIFNDTTNISENGKYVCATQLKYKQQ